MDSTTALIKFLKPTFPDLEYIKSSNLELRPNRIKLSPTLDLLIESCSQGENPYIFIKGKLSPKLKYTERILNYSDAITALIPLLKSDTSLNLSIITHDNISIKSILTQDHHSTYTKALVSFLLGYYPNLIYHYARNSGNSDIIYLSENLELLISNKLSILGDQNLLLKDKLLALARDNNDKPENTRCNLPQLMVYFYDNITPDIDCNKVASAC